VNRETESPSNAGTTHIVWRYNTLPWLLLLVSVALVCTQVERPRLLLNVWVPWAEVGCMALIMTPIVLVGGIDLSVGAIVALCGIVMGVLIQDFGWTATAATIAALSTGTAAGALNGTLITMGISPLVTTLATMAFFRGLAMTISSADSVKDFPELFLEQSIQFGIPTQFFLLAIVLIASGGIVHFTVFGRWLYAIGDNRIAARFAAVPVRRVDLCLYTACGVVAALVAILNAMRHNVAIPNAHVGMELQAIACIVVGGTLITGGHGSILRTLLGLAIISNLDIALGFLSSRVQFVNSESRLIVIGTLLIAVAVWTERTQGAPES